MMTLDAGSHYELRRSRLKQESNLGVAHAVIPHGLERVEYGARRKGWVQR